MLAVNAAIQGLNCEGLACAIEASESRLVTMGAVERYGLLHARDSRVGNIESKSS